jgi:hypothetical protein
MLIAPSSDLVIVIAAGDRRAGHQKQDLAQWEFHLRRFARILHRPKMIEKKAEAILDECLFHSVRLCVIPEPYESRHRSTRHQNLCQRALT